MKCPHFNSCNLTASGYKFLMIMKLTFILVLAAMLQVSAGTFAQRITLSETNAPLETVLKKIRIQSGYDFFYNSEVVLEIAKVEHPNTIQQIDGKSFVPLLNKSKYQFSDRALIWHNPHKWTPTDGPGINYFSAIRQGPWKLIYNHRNEQFELYNLITDLGENVNMLKKEKAIARKMAGALTEQLKKWDAQMPVNKNTGKMVTWPDKAFLK